MSKNHFLITILIGLLLILPGCTTDETAVSATNSTPGNGKVRLSADYKDALAVQSQLAVGTLQLEETELAVDEALAGELLPLWQAVQSLSGSETAASAEVDAVINQIQDTMQPAQVQAIADMALTNEKLTAMFESGELNMGRGTRQNQDSSDTATGSGFPGGGPGGGIPGGGPGGGIPGSGPGGGFGNLSEDDIATRQAQLESGDGFAQFQDQAVLGAVIRALQTKTGEAPIGQPGGPGGPGDFMNTALEAVSAEIGVSVADMQTQLNDGQTLVQIIEAAGGDVDAARTAMIEALGDLGDSSNFSAEDLVDNWLQR